MALLRPHPGSQLLVSLLPLVLAQGGCSSREVAPSETNAESGASATESSTERGAPLDVLTRFDARALAITTSDEDTRPLGANVDAVLPREAAGERTLRDPSSNVAIRFRLEGASASSVRESRGRWSTYPNAFHGGDVHAFFHREGLEDFVVVHGAETSELRYVIALEEGAHALRSVDGLVEVLDVNGAPRLRVRAPFVFDASKKEHPARVSVEGCSVDESPIAPWRRTIPKLEEDECTLVVRWEGGLSHPLVVDPEWTSSANLVRERTHHTATMITPTGEILLAGGFDLAGTATNSAEILCPAEACPPTAVSTPTGNLIVARGAHTETLVSGAVLVTGGRASTAGARLGSTEIYNVTTGTFAAGPAMSIARASHTATRLDPETHRVLIAGGEGTNPSSAQVFNATTNGFEAGTITMGAQRSGHVADLAGQTGKVLIAGGIGSLNIALSTAELFDPVTNTFSPTGSMTSQRAFATATKLEDVAGSVLVAGGTNGVGFFYQTADIYVPTTGTFQQQPVVMQVPRAFHAATKLVGKQTVLITGGENASGLRDETEVFSQLTTSFSLASQMGNVRNHHTATLLPSGQAIVTGGGRNGANVIVASAISSEILQRSNGEACAKDGECASGNCSQDPIGICCDFECEDICESCRADEVGAIAGVCHTVADGTPVASGCDQAVAFQITCEAGEVSTTGVQLCGAYACVGQDCGAGACDDDADCSATGWCAPSATGSICKFKQDLGTVCGETAQCESGFCVDGHCCASACEGQCQACDDPENPGACVQVTGAPHAVDSGFRSACLGTGSECEGSCGTNTSACDYTTKGCGTPSCVDGELTVGQCHTNTNGACTETTVTCAPFACNGAGTDCRSDCQKTEDCAPGNVCNGTNCVIVQERSCDGEHTVVSPDGNNKDCSPYNCKDDACLNRCLSIDDCVAPNVCTQGGECVAPPDDPAPPEGCAVSTPVGRSDGAAWMALGLVLALARRARSARQVGR